MKQIMRTAVGAFAGLALTSAAMAADWTPPGPIKMMIAFGAGGGADTQARLIAEDIEAALGWKFIPEQVTGKGGMNLAMAIKDQPNDGSVIGMVVTETMGYNMRVADAGVTPADYTAISTTAGFQMGLVSAASRGWTRFEDVVAAAKAGEKIRFGAASPKLADLAYLLGKAQGIDFNIVAVKGGRAVVNGVNAGDLDIGFVAGLQSKGVAAGDLVNLASGLTKPLLQTPDAPTLADLGVSFHAEGYFAFVGPAGMPDDARDALAAAIGKVITTKGMKSHGMIKKAFGAAAVIAGADLQSVLDDDFAASGALLEAASE